MTGLLAAEGGRGRVVILIEASEESGSPDLSAYVEHLGDRIGRPRLVICLDSGGLSYDRLWLTSSLRGNLVASVRVDVLTEGVHSGVGGRRGAFLVPDPAPHPVPHRGRGHGRDPPARAPGRRDPGRPTRPRSAAVGRSSPTLALPTVDGLRLCWEPSPADRLIAKAWSRRARGDRHGRPARRARRRATCCGRYTTAKILAPPAARRRCPGGGRRPDLGHHHR